MQNLILQEIQEVIKAANVLKKEKSVEFIANVAKLIAQTFQNGNKILIAGNGGSLCDAMHFAEEFTGQFRKRRRALPAMSLSEPGHMSCVANDFGYEEVFSRGVEAFGKKGDVFIALTTSGNSSNLVLAVEMAQKLSLKTVGFLGKTGGKLKDMCDLEWIVEGFATSDRIQEVHMAAIHVIIEAVENKLFYSTPNQILSSLKNETAEV